MRIALYIFFTLMNIQTIGQTSSNVQLKFHWDNDTLVGSSTYNNTYNEIWGYAQNGREYAIIGSTAGTHFFDVTDPVNTQEVGYIAGRHFLPTDIIHRDYHDYKGYLYAVSDEGASSLQIIDLRQLPDTVFTVYDSSDLIKNSHNIFIDTATAKLYACNVRTNEPRYANFQVYDLSNPIDPVLLFEENEYGVHDIYARNDTVYLNSGNDGLIIYKFSNSSNPQLLGTLTSYTDQGYNHSGWIDASGKTYYMADETHGMHIKAFNTSQLSDLEELSTFGSDIDVNSIAHNLIWRDNYLFVSYYHDGLQIFDVSNPSQPKKVGYYDTFPANDHSSYKGAWGVYPSLPSGIILVSDMQTGLYVLSAPKFIGVKNQKMDQVMVSPNPFIDQINIEIPSDFNQKMRLQIVDMQGKTLIDEWHQIYHGQLRYQLDLSSGVYLIKLDSDNLKFEQKLIRY